jgi:integrase
MAEVSQRAWRIPGQRTKRLAWGFSITIDGKRTKTYRSEWTREDAERALAALQLGIAQEPKPTAGMTFAAAVEEYLKAKSRKRTLRQDQSYLEDFTTAFGATTPLIEITAKRVSSWRSERLSATNQRTGQPLGAAAINRPLGVLLCLLRLARDEWEVLSTIPKIRREREPQGRIRWLSEEEIVRLLDACSRSRNPELRPAVVISLHTGLRRGELFGLDWDRIDLTRGVIKLELTKTGKRREVPLNEESYAALVQLQPRESGRVFRSARIRSAFEAAVKNARIEDFHFHDLRHTFASWLVMKGKSILAVQQLLGHANIAMTMKYAHLAPGHLREAVSGLSGLTGTARVGQVAGASAGARTLNGSFSPSNSA